MLHGVRYTLLLVICLLVAASCADQIADPELEKLRADDLNKAPIVVNDTALVRHSRALDINVLSNDYDENGPLDTSTLRFTQPANGLVARRSDSILTYTPTAGHLGEDTFSYTIKDDFGVESAPASVVLLVVVGLPEAPELAYPDNESVNQPGMVLLAWDSTRFTDTYEVQVATEDRFIAPVFRKLTADLQQNAGPLPREQLYYWRIRGINVVGKGAWSKIRTFETIPNAPGAPDLLAPQNGAEGELVEILLQWEILDTATSYQVQVADNRAFGSAVVNEGASLGQYRAAPGVLSYGQQYYWRIRATNSGGTGPWSVTWGFETRPPVPAVPTLVSPKNGTITVNLRPDLSWTSVTGALLYEIQLANEVTFEQPLAETATVVNKIRLSDGMLRAGTRYFWRVRSRNGTGESPWTEAWWFETPGNDGVVNDQ